MNAVNTEYSSAVVAALAARKYDTVIDFNAMANGAIVPIENEKRHDITRPTPNTMTGICWQICDYVYSQRVAMNAAEPDASKHVLPVPLISEVLPIFERTVAGAKAPTMRQQCGYWVKFYGLEAMRDERVKAEGSAEDAAKEAAKAEKARIKAEKAAERERLKAEKEAKALEKLAANEDKLKAEIERANARAAALAAKAKALEDAKAKAAAEAAKGNADASATAKGAAKGAAKGKAS